LKKKIVEKVNVPNPANIAPFGRKKTDNNSNDKSNEASADTDEIPVSERESIQLQRCLARKAKSEAENRNKGKRMWKFPASPSNLKTQNNFQLLLYRALLHDTGLICGLFILPCIGFTTLVNYRLLFQEGKLPTSVLLVWFLSIFVVGMEAGRIRGLRQANKTMMDTEGREIIPPGYVLLCQGIPRVWSWFHPYEEVQVQLNFLQSSRTRNVRFLSSSRQLKSSLTSSDKNNVGNEDDGIDDSSTSQHRIGQVDVFHSRVGPDLLKAVATSSDTNSGTSIPPSPTELKSAFWLRGLDCFLGPPQDDICNHDFLIAQGLRNMPTFVINVQLCFANILVYFALPEWFTDFDDLRKRSKMARGNNCKEDDSFENLNCPIKAALFNFIIGSDEYRNRRISLMSHLVDGPMPIRMLSPPAGQEMLVAQEHRGISTKWTEHPEQKNLKPCLELEVDLVSSKPLRTLSLLCKRYVKTVQLDLAIILSDNATNGPYTPVHGKREAEQEAKACIGYWRFDYLDIDACPCLPERKKEVEIEDKLDDENHDSNDQEDKCAVDNSKDQDASKRELLCMKRDIQRASQLFISLSSISTPVSNYSPQREGE